MRSNQTARRRPTGRRHGGEATLDKKDRFLPCGWNTCLIRVYSYERKELRGALRFARQSREREFQSLMEMLFLLEEGLDSGERQQIPWTQWEGKHRGVVVFQIKILFRQNATWQGSLLWLDRQQEAQFRSVLELLELLDSVLTTVWGETTHEQGS